MNKRSSKCPCHETSNVFSVAALMIGHTGALSIITENGKVPAGETLRALFPLTWPGRKLTQTNYTFLQLVQTFNKFWLGLHEFTNVFTLVASEFIHCSLYLFCNLNIKVTELFWLLIYLGSKQKPVILYPLISRLRFHYLSVEANTPPWSYIY